MHPKRINTVTQESWARAPLSRFLRRGQFRILGFRETAWCYVVGLITAIFICWHSDGVASLQAPALESGEETAGTQLVDNKGIANDLVSLDPFRFETAQKPMLIALNIKEIQTGKATHLSNPRTRGANLRLSDGRKSPKIRMITTTKSSCAEAIPAEAIRQHVIVLEQS
jgi:hypothetical protein